MNLTNSKNNGIQIQLGFIKRVKISIAKVEEYFWIAADGWKRSIAYILKVLIIFALLISIAFSLKLNYEMRNLAETIENNVPNFEIKEGKFKIESDNSQLIELNNSSKTKIIMENSNDIDKYLSEIDKRKEDFVVFLTDKVYINTELSGLMEYQYSELGTDFEISKDTVVAILYSKKLILIIFIYIFAGIFIIYLIRSLINILLISIVGRLGSIVTQIPLKYSALFSMATSAITLPIILTLLYIVLYIFTGFTIENFEMLYTIISYIYMITAVILLKTNYIKTKNIFDKDKEGKEA